MIRVREFYKYYKDTQAVAGLSFTVAPGQILALVGPNGAGKTTTLRALAGIIPATTGLLEIGGFDIARDTMRAKQVLGYVPDDPALFGSLTLYEHLLFAASAYGVQDREQRAENLLQEFGIVDKRDDLAQEVSRGVRQKIAICAAYIHDPRAVLFDEPMTGLDPQGIHVLKHSIRRRVASGTAVLISSHLLALIEDLCTHLLVLDKGRCLYSGSLQEARAESLSKGSQGTLEAVFQGIIGGRPPP